MNLFTGTLIATNASSVTFIEFTGTAFSVGPLFAPVVGAALYAAKLAEEPLDEGAFRQLHSTLQEQEDRTDQEAQQELWLKEPQSKVRRSR